MLHEEDIEKMKGYPGRRQVVPWMRRPRCISWGHRDAGWQWLVFFDVEEDVRLLRQDHALTHLQQSTPQLLDPRHRLNCMSTPLLSPVFPLNCSQCRVLIM